MTDAQKLMSDIIEEHKEAHGWPRACTGCSWRGFEIHADHVAAEIDKALGELTRAWAAVWPDGSYIGPYHEVWNFHPNKSARELAEADVAEHEDTELKSRWVSSYTEVTE